MEGNSINQLLCVFSNPCVGKNVHLSSYVKKEDNKISQKNQDLKNKNLIDYFRNKRLTEITII